MRVKGQNSVDKKSILQFGKQEERSILDLFPYKSSSLVTKTPSSVQDL